MEGRGQRSRVRHLPPWSPDCCRGTAKLRSQRHRRLGSPGASSPPHAGRVPTRGAVAALIFDVGRIVPHLELVSVAHLVSSRADRTDNPLLKPAPLSTLVRCFRLNHTSNEVRRYPHGERCSPPPLPRVTSRQPPRPRREPLRPYARPPGEGPGVGGAAPGELAPGQSRDFELSDDGGPARTGGRGRHGAPLGEPSCHPSATGSLHRWLHGYGAVLRYVHQAEPPRGDRVARCWRVVAVGGAAARGERQEEQESAHRLSGRRA